MCAGSTISYPLLVAKSRTTSSNSSVAFFPPRPVVNQNDAELLDPRQFHRLRL